MSLDYVPASGNIGAKLVILTDSPTYSDVANKRLFSDTVGREVDRMLKEVGISRAECWVTSASKHYVMPSPKGKRIPFPIRAKNSGVNIEEELANLKLELDAIKPNCILALGGASLWALTGKYKINNFRGSIIQGMGYKTVPTYHPQGLINSSETSAEFMGYWNRAVILFDIKRAVEQSKFPDSRYQKKLLSVIRNSGELYEFRSTYAKQYSRVGVDIEAGGQCLPICVGLSYNGIHGVTAPLWNEGGISSIPDSDMVRIWMVISEILSTTDIIGQNFNYDRDKLARLGFTIKRLVSDTLLKAFAINPELPKSLAFNTSIYTEEPFYKDEGMYEGSLEDLLIGCARDACVTVEIDKKMEPDLKERGMVDFYNNFLMKLPEMYLEIENTGFKVNPVTRDFLVHKYVEWDERVRYDLYQRTGIYLNTNSPKQVKQLLVDTLGIPLNKGTGEEELTEVLNRDSFKDENNRRICELILESRRVRKTISTYMMALPDFDGKMKTTCRITLDTGRTANGQQEPPIRPVIEIIDENGKKKKKPLGIAFQTITKHGDIGSDVRLQYEPLYADEVFVQLDSSQAEARVTSLLANDEKMLAMYNDHDIHALTASWFFGGDEAKFSKKVLGYECPERFIGKTLRHAGERGAKKKRAASEVNTNARKYRVPIKIDESDAEHALLVFHRMCPNIERVYFAEVINCIRRNRTLIAPLPYGIDSQIGGVRVFYERWGDELNRQAFSYLPQRAVTDNTKAAGLRIKKLYPNTRLVLESHDALLFSVKERILEEFIKVSQVEMERPLSFANCSLPRHDLIIPCEVEVGTNYKELKKWKFPTVLST